MPPNTLRWLTRLITVLCAFASDPSRSVGYQRD